MGCFRFKRILFLFPFLFYSLIISQLITLYITPVIYLALEWFQERVLDRVPFLRSGHMHHEGEAGSLRAPGKDAPIPEPAGVQ